MTSHYVGKILHVKAGESLSLQYHERKDEAFLVQDNTGDATVRSFDYDYDLASRFWFGAENCEGLGARLRYFYYSQSADPELGVVDLGNTNQIGRSIALPATTRSVLPWRLKVVPTPWKRMMFVGSSPQRS